MPAFRPDGGAQSRERLNGLQRNRSPCRGLPEIKVVNPSWMEPSEAQLVRNRRLRKRVFRTHEIQFSDSACRNLGRIVALIIKILKPKRMAQLMAQDRHRHHSWEGWYHRFPDRRAHRTERWCIPDKRWFWETTRPRCRPCLLVQRRLPNRHQSGSVPAPCPRPTGWSCHAGSGERAHR
jgi:hypothetical protein